MLHCKMQAASNRPGVIAGLSKKKAMIALTNSSVPMSDLEIERCFECGVIWLEDGWKGISVVR